MKIKSINDISTNSPDKIKTGAIDAKHVITDGLPIVVDGLAGIVELLVKTIEKEETK